MRSRHPDEDDATVILFEEAAAVLRRAHRRRRLGRWLRRGLALSLVVALVGAAGAGVVWRRRALARGGPTVASVVPELVRFVERTRGLELARVPAVHALATDAFDREVGRTHSATEAQAGGETLQALGHVRDAAEHERRAAASRVTDTEGFYDGRDVYVRGTTATPYLRAVLVHELTHAVDDQHFGLGRIQQQAHNDDEKLAVGALVEGSATRIEQSYVASLSPADRAAYEKERDRRSGSGGRNADEDIRLYLGYFPYSQGPELVDKLLAAGGQARLAAAFDQPPRSSEQALSVPAYLRGDAPRKVATPSVPTGRRAAERGVLGRIGLYVILADRLPGPAASDAAAGWGGDAYVTWREPGGLVCSRWNFVMDSETDRQELAAALRLWNDVGPRLGRRGDATVTSVSDGVTSLRACG